MHMFKEAFFMLSIVGVWRPINWKSKKQIIVYKIFSLISVAQFISICLLHLLTLYFSELTFVDFTETLYNFLTLTLDTCRALNYLLNRQCIIDLANMLRKTCCQPRNARELKVQKTMDAFIRKATILINWVVAIILTMTYIDSAMSKDERYLPDHLSPPYDLQSPRNYWLTYSFEAIIYAIDGFVNLNECCIVSGFMLNACVQFDILALRLRELIQAGPEYSEKAQQRTIKNLVIYHLHVIRYSRKITEAFYWTMIVQLIVVSIITTLIIYRLINSQPGVLDLIVAVVYVFCVGAQFFSYCWIGNEIMLKSQKLGNVIYETDWLSLNRESKKMLLFVMQRSSTPFTLRCGYLVTLDLTSFKGILKLSYSSFNFLRETR